MKMNPDLIDDRLYAGLPWVTSVPNHWCILRGKVLFRQVSRPPRDQDEVITAFRDGVVTLRRNRRTEGFTESFKEIGYQGIRKNDLVIHAMDGFAGAIGVSNSDGKASPVYVVCQPLLPLNVDYYAYLLRHLAHAGFILALAKGIRERSTDFRFSDFGVLRLPYPPPPEQDAIVHFLNQHTQTIRSYSDLQRRLTGLLPGSSQSSAGLLQEYRIALIAQAITGKIDVRSNP
jgi:type I restriction enzyme, S subunit